FPPQPLPVNSLSQVSCMLHEEEKKVMMSSRVSQVKKQRRLSLLCSILNHL
ncbi:unnamed protein product, partial [Arabidopsis halleri]